MNTLHRAINSHSNILQPDTITSTDISINNSVGRVFKSQIKIPVYKELLDSIASYEETIILNQLIYYYDKSEYKKGLSIYDLKHLCLWDKSFQTLRKKLKTLEAKGYIESSNHTLYGKTLYRPKNTLYIKDNTLASLVESEDLPYGDYFTAAIINLFRQNLLSGSKAVKLSMQEIVDKLRLDRSRTAVKARLTELIRIKLIKPHLTGRIYTYELNENAILRIYSPEILQDQSKILEDIFIEYLNYIDKYNKKKNISFQRMLFDGYQFEDIKHIIAFLGGNKYWQNIIVNPSLLRQHYTELIELSYNALSKRKANRFIYKLQNNLLEKHLNLQEAKVYIEQENTPNLSDEKLWNTALFWCESNRNLIMSIYNKYSSMNSILEENDVYNTMIQIIYKHLKKKNSNLVRVTSSYLDKHIKGLMYAGYTRESELPSEDIISDESYSIPTNSDYSLANLKNIPEQLSHIPYNELSIIFDYIGADGKIYTQRELSKKYDMSLGSINTIISKRLNEIYSIYNLAPPNRLRHKK